MTVNPQLELLFKEGFPLEEPEVLLPWGKSIQEVAQKSGGVPLGGRFYWKSVKYLQGLRYPLFSESGTGASDPFHVICAYVGVTPKGWSDEASIKGFGATSKHLIHLFGEPVKQQAENESGEKDMSWQVGPIHFSLGMVEIFVLRCYLQIRHTGQSAVEDK